MTFLLATALLVGGIYSWLKAQQAVEDLGGRILNEHASLVEKEVQEVIQRSERFGQLVGDVAAGDETLNASDLSVDRLKSLMIVLGRLIASAKDLSYLSLTTASNGEFVQASRRSDGVTILQINQWVGSGSYIRRDYEWKDGKSRLLKEQAWTLDSRTRPYYQLAKSSGKQSWTRPYVFIPTEGAPPEAGITCATPLFDDGGKFIGVATADLSLRGISLFLDRVRFGESAYAFIVDRTDVNSPTMIAHPKIQTITESDGGARMVSASNLTDVAARRVFLNSGASDSKGYRQVEVDGIGGFFATSRLLAANGLKWEIFALAPESYFDHTIAEARRIVSVFGLVLLSGGVILSALVAWRVTDPLRRLSEDAQRLQRLEIGDEERGKSSIAEVDQLSISFDVMKAGLRSFTKLVPMDYVKYLIENRQEAVLGGERRNMTVFFGDMEGFTEQASASTPDDSFRALTDFFEEMSKAIHNVGGTIDKYIGDAIMAFWGAPVKSEDHAVKACHAAWSSWKAFEDLGGKLGRARFGIESGDMMVGNLGTTKRMDYTVIGDNVNLASRLQGLCKYYGCAILVGEGTFEAAKSEFLFQTIDRVSVMGRENDDLIYELVSPVAEASEMMIRNARDMDLAFQLYSQRQFEEARNLYDRLGTNRRLADRCAKFVVEPPNLDWDAVFRPDFK